MYIYLYLCVYVIPAEVSPLQLAAVSKMNQSGVEFGCDSAHLQLAVMTSRIQVISAGVCSQREKPSLELRSLFVCWFVDSFLSFFPTWLIFLFNEDEK